LSTTFPPLQLAPEPNILSFAYRPHGQRLMASGDALRDSRFGRIYDRYAKCLIFETRTGKVVADLPGAHSSRAVNRRPCLQTGRCWCAGHAC
jgi:hypothetical protein